MTSFRALLLSARLRLGAQGHSPFPHGNVCLTNWLARPCGLQLEAKASSLERQAAREGRWGSPGPEQAAPPSQPPRGPRTISGAPGRSTVHSAGSVSTKGQQSSGLGQETHAHHYPFWPRFSHLLNGHNNHQKPLQP